MGSHHLWGRRSKLQHKALPASPLVPLPLCPSPHLGPCFYSAMENCLDLAIRTGGAAGSDAPTQTFIRHLPHPSASHKTNNPAISDRAASFSSSVLFAGDGVCGTVIDISGRAAKPDTRADYRLRHHLYMIYHRLDICFLFHNNYCLLC